MRTNAFLERLEAFDVHRAVAESARQSQDQLADMQRFQMSEGKGRDGGYMLRYRDDPYFQSLAGALAYERWKMKISPNNEKPAEYADFIIRGDFYSTINVQVTNNFIDFYSDSHIASDINAKTRNTAFGLNEASYQEAWIYLIRPKLLKKIAAGTGMRINRR